MKIDKVALFATPDSVDALQAWLDGLPNDVRGHAMTAAYMTWNLLAEELHRDERERERAANLG